MDEFHFRVFNHDEIRISKSKYHSIIMKTENKTIEDLINLYKSQTKIEGTDFLALKNDRETGFNIQIYTKHTNVKELQGNQKSENLDESLNKSFTL